jgi:hypothetical protein
MLHVQDVTVVLLAGDELPAGHEVHTEAPLVE